MTNHRFRAILASAAIASLMTAGQLASAQQPPEQDLYVRVDAVNVRGGPGVSNIVIEVLLLGTEVRIYATSGNWSRISPPGKPEKWIYTPMLQREKPPVKAKAKTKVKEQPRDEHPSGKDTPSGKQTQPKAEPKQADTKTSPKSDDGKPGNQPDSRQDQKQGQPGQQDRPSGQPH